jgi:hypothetical protein
MLGMAVDARQLQGVLTNEADEAEQSAVMTGMLMTLSDCY